MGRRMPLPAPPVSPCALRVCHCLPACQPLLLNFYLEGQASERRRRTWKGEVGGCSCWGQAVSLSELYTAANLLSYI